MFIYQTELRDRYYDQVIDLYKNEHLSLRKISKIFPLSKTTVAKWIANFVAENPQQARVMRRKYVEDQPKSQEQAPTEALPKDVQALQAELKKLRAQLTQAEIKAEAYDELINVAEARFNIQIRKKAGAKQ